MNNELNFYLGNVTTPENVALIEQAEQLLTKIELISHHVDIDNILSTADNHTTETNLHDIFNVYSEYIESSINEFGIHLSDDSSLENKVNVLESLTIIPYYGDPLPIADVIQQETDSQDKISDILAIVSSKPSFYYNLIVVSVNEDIVDRIQSAIEKNIPEETERNDLEHIRQRFVKFRQHFPGYLGQQAIEKGITLGTTLEYLFRHYVKELDEAEGKPEELAGHVLSLVTISAVENQDILETCKELIEDLAKDINVVTKTVDHLIKMLKEL